MIDGITQLTEAQIQLSEAKSQIEAGINQIHEAYKSIADQTDLGGMLSISTVSQPADGTELLHACRVH